jgi:hypothetical protein
MQSHKNTYYYKQNHAKLFLTNNHLSSLHTQYSMVPFCRPPPPPPPPPPPTHELLIKKALTVILQTCHRLRDI